MRTEQVSYDARSADARPTARGGLPAGRTAEIVGRVVGAGLLLGMAWIHWHLYYLGFATVPRIGPAFYANAVLGALAAAAVLVTPRRWLGWTALAAALLDAGTLLALVLSLTVGLLGFHESTDAPLLTATWVVELLGVLVLGWLAWAFRPPLARRWNRPDRGVV